MQPSSNAISSGVGEHCCSSTTRSRAWLRSSALKCAVEIRRGRGGAAAAAAADEERRPRLRLPLAEAGAGAEAAAPGSSSCGSMRRSARTRLALSLSPAGSSFFRSRPQLNNLFGSSTDVALALP
eukprot:COSAG01_NODE_4611_length_4879_cov_9.632845_1_plen_124_part_10